MVYTYTTLNEVGDQKHSSLARIHRSDGMRGELRFPSGARVFEIAPDGVVAHNRSGETAFVLKLPIVVGTSWRGEHGGQSRILNADLTVDSPAGHYENCVQTMEERLGDPPHAATPPPSVPAWASSSSRSPPAPTSSAPSSRPTPRRCVCVRTAPSGCPWGRRPMPPAPDQRWGITGQGTLISPHHAPLELGHAGLHLGGDGGAVGPGGVVADAVLGEAEGQARRGARRG